MRKIITAVSVACMAMLCPVQHSKAVTPDELEQARTMAALVYLRNVNPTSDYLNDIKVSTRSELSTKLKDKEKQNLKTFNSHLPSTSGSESWGRAELLEFAKKAVVAPGGYSSTGYASKMVETKINGMKLSVSKPKPTADESTMPQEVVETQVQPQQPMADTVRPVNIPEPFATEEQNTFSEDSALQAARDSLAAAEADLQRTQDSGSSSGVYIVILCVLVALVIALVIYAARYFNRQNGSSKKEERREGQERGDDTVRSTAPAVNVHVNSSESEVVASLRAENAELRRAIEEYKYHINYLKAEREKRETQDMQDRIQSRTTQRLEPVVAERATTAGETLNDRYAGTDTARIVDSNRRVIYLGRANQEGMFIRAERNLNPQHSVFRLVTSDNINGRFMVAEQSEVEERILANPELLLAASCEITDTDTYGKEAVVTEKEGIAIFKNGRWYVHRPAQVKFV